MIGQAPSSVTWIRGVSTRRVDELVQAMGLSSISKSQVSKLCKDIDERVNAFLDRPLDGEWPYLWLDATTSRSGTAGRIVSVAAIIACGCFGRRSARDHRPRYRPVGGRAVLVGILEELGQARALGRQAGDLGRP